MKKILLIAMGIVFMASAVSSETEGHRLATLAFLGVDENGDGYASLEEQLNQRKISLSQWTPMTTAT